MIFDELLKICLDMKERTDVKEELFIKLGETVFKVCSMQNTLRYLKFKSVGNLVVEKPVDKYDEVFYFLEIESSVLANILPEPLKTAKGRYVHTCEEGKFAVSSEYGFFSLYVEKSHETFIWMCPDKYSVSAFITHPFRMELSWWALRNDLLFLHSAALGMEGKGIILSGAGGSGKSTLALSGMILGMDYLSDDYVLVDPKEGPTLTRIYDTGYLKDDILKRLPEMEENIIWRCEEREKTLVRLDKQKYSIKDRLPLNAIIVPHIIHTDTPYIRRNSDIRKLIPLLASTSYQSRELRNRDVFFRMMTVLQKMPAYDYFLSDDIRKNADFLKKWIKEL